MELVVTGKIAIEDNLEKLEAGLLVAMERYDIVVTEDNIADSKKQRAEVNKGKKAIMDAWKVRKQELEAPIKELDTRLKKLLTICDDTMARIDAQVEKFEEGKRNLAQTLSEEYKNQLCIEKGINPEAVSVIGFNNLTYITSKGALASVAKEKIDNLVLLEVARIAEIKAKEAEAILERERIRQEAKAEAMEEARAEAKAEAEAERSLFAQQPQAYQEPAPIAEPVVETRSDGKEIYKVHAIFEVVAMAGSEQRVIEKIKEEINKNPLLAKALKGIVRG